MPNALKFMLPLLAIVSLCGLTTPARGAKYGVTDDGHFFSADVVTQVEQVIRQIRTGDDKDVFVTTYDKIPDDLKDKYNPDNKAKFFSEWADKIGVQNGVSGIVILMTRDPRHIEIVVGNNTQHRTFTQADRSELVSRMVMLLKEDKYDDALLAGVKFIKERMDANERRVGAAQGSSPPPPYPTQNPINSGGKSVGGLVCLGIGLLVIVFMIISAANRNRGYGAPPPPGGYPPSYGGGYPPQGGYGGGFQGGGGGGGGFGRGLLGGLLGGAIGSWGYDKFAHPGAGNPSYPPPQGGGADFAPPPDQPDTSFSGGGADFGGGSDSSGGGGDFGGGGGGDFGGGGGDSGGGGGGDF